MVMIYKYMKVQSKGMSKIQNNFLFIKNRFTRFMYSTNLHNFMIICLFTVTNLVTTTLFVVNYLQEKTHSIDDFEQTNYKEIDNNLLQTNVFGQNIFKD